MTSVVNSNNTLGFPDGAYWYSSGQEITLSGFDFSAVSGRELTNVTLLVSFSIPDPLQQDEVRFIVSWPGSTELVRTYAHTQVAIDHMSGNPAAIPLDSLESWTWSILANVSVTIDYHSEGSTDDSRVEVDAVGLSATYFESWYSFETAKAEASVLLSTSPVIDLNLTLGQTTNLAQSPCGLELIDSATGGTWISTVHERPYGQSWGRVHMSTSGNASVEVRGSADAQNWFGYTLLNDPFLLPDHRFLEFKVDLLDGCLTRVRADINDPTVTVSGHVSGAIDDLVVNVSTLRVAFEGVVLLDLPLTLGGFSHSIPVGHLLPAAGELIDIGLRTRFQWSSDGHAETTVVVVDDIMLSGGFVVEWDRDPSCDDVTDRQLDEDASGAVIPLLSTCNDDITAWQDLQVSADSGDTSLLTVSVVDGQLVVSQQPEQHGQTTVMVQVQDERGNSWVSNFSVTVNEVEDAPTHAPLPLEVQVEVGESLVIELGVEDVDTPLSELQFNTDVSWAFIDQSGNLILEPIAEGSFDVSITISDGVNTVQASIGVLATAEPDLLIEQITLEHIQQGQQGQQAVNVTQGDVVTITAWVRNSGRSAANLVLVRCYVDDQLVGTSSSIPVIAPDQLASTSCDWQVGMGGGSASIRVVVDPLHDIQETNEENNEAFSEVTIEPPISDDDGGDQRPSGGGISISTPMFWTLAGAIILVTILAFQLGPSKIRRFK
ncbi:MAG: hypothetical protein CXX72_03740 [Methanobacteriota archaeon]|nr:MAG: hypothetical protein CXX72_03740 [Euryarchaeota archaeon]